MIVRERVSLSYNSGFEKYLYSGGFFVDGFSIFLEFTLSRNDEDVSVFFNIRSSMNFDALDYSSGVFSYRESPEYLR